ncbi:MAG: aldose 1-epimerase family protein [Clostridia bacterium]|nr:aldose 1-epimerase family protein [Clostridia bacterium]
MDTTAESYLLTGNDLVAVISRRGGELRSLKYRDTELIWQGDPAYWDGSAPLLFPFCGRVKDGVYRWQGQDYPMPIHGFLPEATLSAAEIEKDRLTLTLTDSPATRAVYPFAFGLSLSYQLTDNALSLTATVTAGDTGLPFSFGAHPGFHLPLANSGFGDAVLRFDAPSPLARIEITDAGLLGNGRSAYPLSDATLPLSPDPAGGCGIFFEVPKHNRALTLESPALPCNIRMEFADFPILGLWHAEGAPYLCIEPWQGLPAPADPPTDLSDKPGTVRLAPGRQKTFNLRIILQQKGICHV